MESINAKKRTKNTHHGARQSRRLGNVPGILYGKGISNLMFEIGEVELNGLINSQGEHGIINVNLEGQSFKTLIKEVQRDPVNGRILHIDLEDVKSDKKIVSTVPIHFIGEDFVNKRGGVVQKEKDNVKIRCTPDALPKYVELDISKGEVGSQFKLADVEFASDLSILDDLQTVLASISYEQKLVEAVE